MHSDDEFALLGEVFRVCVALTVAVVRCNDVLLSDESAPIGQDR